MSNRVQIILSEGEKERFAREARRAGVSLSAWLRQAGHARLRAEAQKGPFTPDELDALLVDCRARETGTEPDWDQHVRVIDRSQGSGAADS